MAWATLRNTVLRVWAEVRQTWPFLIFLLGFVASWMLAVMLTADSADRVRYFGTVLQLAGIVLVGLGLRDLRRKFDRPGVFAAMWARVVAIVRSVRPRHLAIVVPSEGIAVGSSAAIAYSRVGGTIEQRLDGLEWEIDDIRKQADERERKVERRFEDLRATLSTETQHRKDAHAEITERLDNLAVGGLYLEVIGLWWLVFATMATCIPEEIAALF